MIIWYLHCLTTKCSADRIAVHSCHRRRGARRDRRASRKKPTTPPEDKNKNKHLGHFHLYGI